jgi:hypothetical protein
VFQAGFPAIYRSGAGTFAARACAGSTGTAARRCKW